MGITGSSLHQTCDAPWFTLSLDTPTPGGINMVDLTEAGIREWILAHEADMQNMRSVGEFDSIEAMASWMVEYDTEMTCIRSELRTAKLEIEELNEQLVEMLGILGAEERPYMKNAAAQKNEALGVVACEEDDQGEGDCQGGEGEPEEPFICPECQCQGTKSKESQVCSRCESEYQRGRADPEWAFNSDPDDLANLSIYDRRDF